MLSKELKMRDNHLKNILETDVLIIGTGGTGLRAALEAVKYNIQVACLGKEIAGKAHTCMAEGGYNAVLRNVDPEDSIEAHRMDTITGGAFLNDQALVNILVKESPERMLDLEMYGGVFDRTPDGRIMQRKFGKQSHPRTCYAGDYTGREILTTLVEAIRKEEDIELFDETFATSLVVEDNQVTGVTFVDIKTGELNYFRAKATVMAAGGGLRAYRITTNAQADTGDGFAMAYKAGVNIISMEQIQFHPTGMAYPPSVRGTLVTEAVRGEGGRLFNAKGERFMKRYNPELMELAGRDQVARSIATEVQEGRGTAHGAVYLDVSHLSANLIEERLPKMLEAHLEIGIDIRKEPMEVTPSAHYIMGGIEINNRAETNLKGLYAAGEVTGGIHGANRLGGNSLADTQVFGKIAGENAAKFAKEQSLLKVNHKFYEQEETQIYSLLERNSGSSPTTLHNRLRDTMWDNVGIFRTEEGLKNALKELEAIKTALPRMTLASSNTYYNTEWIRAMELINMVLMSEMITRSALARKESRGAHTRLDFPQIDNKNWLVVLKTWKRNGEMLIEKISQANIEIAPKI